MDWLYEGYITVYLVLGAAAAACLAMWWSSQGPPPSTFTPRRRAREEALAEWGAQVRKRHGEVPALEEKSAPPTGGRNPLLLAASLAALLLGGAYFVLDRAVETRREQITRKLYEMAGAVEAKDTRAILAHLSPRFRYFDTGREAFVKTAQGFLDDRPPWVDSVVIWDVRLDAEKPNEALLFAKPKGGKAEGMFFLVRTQWVQDADGEWRMASFTAHKPGVDTKESLPLPRLNP